MKRYCEPEPKPKNLTNENSLTKADKVKMFGEYLTTYRSILVLHQGSTAYRDLDDIHTKAKSMVEDIYMQALQVSGLDELIGSDELPKIPY